MPRSLSGHGQQVESRLSLDPVVLSQVHQTRDHVHRPVVRRVRAAVHRRRYPVPLAVADRVLETLRMSREVGGSELTTVLRNLATYLRQEAAIRSEVEARQSWVINAARLGAAAPWIILVLLSTRPEAAAAYNTPGGTTLIVGGLVASVIAYRIMIRIGRITEEQRWFR